MSDTYHGRAHSNGKIVKGECQTGDGGIYVVGVGHLHLLTMDVKPPQDTILDTPTTDSHHVKDMEGMA